MFAVSDYMPRHPKLNKDIRAVLIDWMVRLVALMETSPLMYVDYLVQVVVEVKEGGLLT